jgi:anti-anti-sigma factor
MEVMVEQFSAVAEKQGAESLLRLSGVLDGTAEAALENAYEAAAAQSPQLLTLEFGDVSYINSTGIALIVGLLARARIAQLPLVATGLSDHYREIFAVTRLSDFIEVR